MDRGRCAGLHFSRQPEQSIPKTIQWFARYLKLGSVSSHLIFQVMLRDGKVFHEKSRYAQVRICTPV